MTYQWNFSIVLEYWNVIAAAGLVTLEIVAMSIVLGIAVGLMLAPLRMSDRRPLRYGATGVIELVRSIPPLVLVVWAYYCLPIVTGLAIPAFWTCVLAISLYSGVFYAEIFRAGVQAIDRGLIEAGLSVGMRPATVMVRVTAPLAFLRILPPFTSQCVMAIKNSVLGSYIAVGEVLYQAQRISIHTFRPLEMLTFVALLFICAILPLTLAAGFLERSVFKKYFTR